MNAASEKAVRAVLSLHCKAPMNPGDIIGPYCAECVSPIDGGPELYPCLTVKAVMDSMSTGTAPAEQRDKIVARKVRELLKHLDSWESQEHTTVTIKFLRRHFKEAE